MSLTITKCNVKVPFQCILEMCLEHPELEELYEDVINEADTTKEYDLRFDGNDYFSATAKTIRKYNAEGDVVLNDDNFFWAYRFHDGVSDYVTWPVYVKHKLKPIKNDK